MRTAAFAGKADPISMSEASNAGVSFDEAITALDHVAFTSSESNWLDTSTLTDQRTIVLRERMYAALDKPAEWYLQPLVAYQPRSHRAFFAGSPPRLFVGEEAGTDPILGKYARWMLFLEVNGRVLEIEVVDDKEGSGERLQSDFLRSLPEPIARSWLWRFTEWKLPREIPCSPIVFRQMICMTTQGIDDVVATFGLKPAERKQSVARIVEAFPDIAPSRKGGRLEMRCFLDTRPMGVNGPVGDQLFTRSRSREGVVYHVRNGDAANLRILENPVEAIDCYHEHLLLKKPGEFDFAPWSKVLAGC